VRRNLTHAKGERIDRARIWGGSSVSFIQAGPVKPIPKKKKHPYYI